MSTGRGIWAASSDVSVPVQCASREVRRVFRTVGPVPPAQRRACRDRKLRFCGLWHAVGG